MVPHPRGLRLTTACRPATDLGAVAPANAGPTAPRCASCELEVTGPPVHRRGLAFCCQGCAAGGPCICSYDEEELDV